MKKTLKTLNIITALFLILIAAAVAYIALPVFGNQALIVRSGSMMPTIDIGSIVVTRGDANYGPGDVIAFRTEKNSKTIVTHRITDIETGADGTFYQTKGDANDNVDGWSVDKQNVLGKVYFTIPYVGQILAFAKTKLGLGLLIVFPASVVILLEVFNIVKEIRKKRKITTVIPDLIGDPRSLDSRFHGNDKSNRNDTNSRNNLNIFGLKIIIPILIAIGVSVPVTFAFLNDTETSANNIIAAANSFGTPTITLTPTQTITPTPTPAATTSAALVINEIYYDPDDDHTVGGQDAANSSEWVEIYNPTLFTVNLKDWKIKDNSVTERTVTTSNRNLGPGEFVILAKAANVRVIWGIDNNIFIPIGETFGNGLANGGDRVILKDSLGNTIDQLSYGTDDAILNPPAPDVATGHSLERNPDGMDTNAAADFVDRTIPQPGL